MKSTGQNECSNTIFKLSMVRKGKKGIGLTVYKMYDPFEMYLLEKLLIRRCVVCDLSRDVLVKE